MLAEFEAVSDGEIAEDMVWVRPAHGGHFPEFHAGQEVVVSLDGDALQCVAAGMTEAEIVSEYAALKPDGIRAAAAHGADLARDEYPAVSAL